MRQQGMVLFTCMMMLAISSLLILSLMQAFFLYVKASAALAKRHQAFYQLEAFANQLRASNLSLMDSRCRVEDKNPNEVLSMLKNHVGCEHAEGEDTYRYLVEDLGEYPCLQINASMGSHHWLISIARIDSKFEPLQIRVAVQVESIQCDGRISYIHAGILSWRHF